MKWKTLRTALALTCAMVITIAFTTTPAAASTTKSATQTAIYKTQYDKAETQVLAMTPGALAGTIAPEATLAQTVNSDVATKMTLKDELYVAKIRQPLTSTEVATAFVMKELILTAKAFEYSDEIKLAGIVTVEPWTQVILRC